MTDLTGKVSQILDDDDDKESKMVMPGLGENSRRCCRLVSKDICY